MHPFPSPLTATINYVKPDLVQVGSLAGNSFSSIAQGYQVNTTNNPGGSSVFWYLNKDMKALPGKYYWEVDSFQSGDDAFWGVVGSTSAIAYLGWFSVNAGIYNFNNDAPWKDSTWTGSSWSPAAFTTQTSGVAGFALDSVNGTLQVYVNNVLQTTLTIGSVPTHLYAAVTWQSGAALTNKLRLGASNTVYSPPSGYTWL